MPSEVLAPPAAALLSQPPESAFVWTIAVALLWLACGPSGVLAARLRDGSAATESRAIWSLRALLLLAVGTLTPQPIAATVHDTIGAVAIPTILVLAGAAAGRALARRFGAVRRARIVASVSIWIIAAAYAASATLGLYDAVLLGVSASIGSWIGSGCIDRQELARTLRAGGYAAFFGALLLEASVRVLLPTAQRAPHNPNPGLFHSRVFDQRCAALFPDAYVDGETNVFSLRSGAEPRKYHVLHVGDSMTEGVGAGLDKAFPAVLARRQLDVAHTNAGFGGSGTDLHALVIYDWVERLAAAGKPVDLVMLHYFGNDEDELGLIYACCDSAPLMIWDGVEPTRRCPQHVRPSAAEEILTGAPPPHLLRATGWISMASTQLILRLWGLESESGPADSRLAGRRVSVLISDIDRYLRERGVDFILIDIGLLPDDPRYAHLPAGESPAIVEARSAGIESYNANEAMRFGRDTAEVDLLRAADGTHYSVAGHEALADWLAPIIERRLARRGRVSGN